jgi:hypothetical protein
VSELADDAGMTGGHQAASAAKPAALSPNPSAAAPAATTATTGRSPSSHECAGSNGISLIASVNGRAYLTPCTAAWPNTNTTNSTRTPAPSTTAPDGERQGPRPSSPL